MIFSIVIPTRNRPDLLLKAIGSVKAQTFVDWELIVVDDASDVSIEKEISTVCDKRIRVIRNGNPLGPAGARNAGIRAASLDTRFVSFLDDDDIFYPDFLEKTYEAMDSPGPETGFSWTGVDFYYPQNGAMRSFFWDPPFQSKEEAFQGFLVKRLIGTGYGITIRKDVFEKVGYFDERLRAVEDTDFFLRVLKYFFYVKVPDVLVRITRQDGNHVNTDSLARALALETIYQKHEREILANYQAWYNFKAKIASIYYRIDRRKDARRVLATAWRDRKNVRILLLWLRLEISAK
jgi:glycosyltransferase involved in cell wall biosynthesis